MSNAKAPGSDPSMDDILASIRKIISDDEARAHANTGQQAPEARPQSAPVAGEPARSPEDVLLLTDLVEEPRQTSNVQPIPLPRIDPAKASEMPQPSLEPQPTVDGLVGAGAAGTTSTAFARLSKIVQESVPPPAAQDPGPSLGSGGKTIENLVKEMLQPMLKDWLDKNLPPLVERYVEREIARLTRR